RDQVVHVAARGNGQHVVDLTPPTQQEGMGDRVDLGPLPGVVVAGGGGVLAVPEVMDRLRLHRLEAAVPDDAGGLRAGTYPGPLALHRHPVLAGPSVDPLYRGPGQGERQKAKEYGQIKLVTKRRTPILDGLSPPETEQQPERQDGQEELPPAQQVLHMPRILLDHSGPRDLVLD